MSSQFARGGRRRRVLNEESRNAASVHATLAAVPDDAAEAPRYGEMASIEHHPQITDYVPRRKRAVLATLAAGATVAVAAQSLVHFADAVSAALPGVAAEQIRDGLAGGLIAWTSAIALLAVAGLARLIYSLRRHRVDDVRGRYRVWKWIAWGGLAASCNAVVGLHAVLSGAAVALTGWSLTTGGAEWWLAPLAIVVVGIGLRLVRETAESRGTLMLVTLAAACYAVAAAGSLGWSPAWLGAWSDALIVAVPMMGHAFALAAMMVFARYVVLDVQGLIEHAPRPAAKPAADAKATKVAEPPAPADPAAPIRLTATVADQDDEDEEPQQEARYLSKAERKRLRKQQRNAA
jgi:hypothetical protein